VRVDRLTCTQFRNLEPLDLSFAPGVNLFVGKNGQGKTNVLEAIQFFKFGRSFRAGRDTELIRFGEAFCRAEITSTLDTGDRETFAASIERGGAKTIKIDGKEIARLSELVGRFPCVLFGPDDLRLVAGAPADRRRFIDMTGSMTAPGYIETARDYRRILQQRNAALKARASERELATWNEQLIAAGAALVECRRVLVDDIAREVAAHAAELRTRSGSFELSYESSLLVGVGSAGDGTPTVADVFAAKLAALADEERRRATTLAGPHRDDVILRLDGTDLRAYGSQGQKRLFAVLLKLAELSYLEGQLGETCVLLLDDVFSEFDRDVTNKLQLLLDGKRQVFVTSPVDLEWARSENARVYGVRAGSVSGGEIPLE
jgi:DNA replication and repair protein RecF